MNVNLHVCVCSIFNTQVPEWMHALKRESGKERRKREVGAPKRRRVSTVSGYDKAKAHRKQQVGLEVFLAC